MPEYHFSNDPKDTYTTLLSVGTKTNPGLHATSQRSVWTDDGDDSKSDAPFQIAMDAMQMQSTRPLEFNAATEFINSSTAGQLDIDAGTTIEVTAPTIELAGATLIDLQGDTVKIGEGGDTDITLTFNANSNDGVLTWMEDEDNFKFSDDVLINGSEKLYLYDIGGEYISSDGTDFTINSGNDIKLTCGASGDVVIPANVGITFGTGEKIEGNNTDLTITSGANINLTATSDVVIPADVGITFGSGEKIEGNDTDLTVTSGADINLTATSDVNIPSDVGVTFGNDGEKIEGDGSDLTISSSGALNVTNSGSGNNIVIDSTAGSVYIDGGESSAAAIYLSATGSHANTTVLISSAGTGASAIDIDSSGGFDLDTIKGITADCTTLSLDSTDTTNLTMTASHASTKVLTISGTNADGSGQADLHLDMDGDIHLKSNITGAITNMASLSTSVSTAAGIQIGTDLAAVDIAIGEASDSNVLISDNLKVGGDAWVSGTLTAGTVSYTTLTITHATKSVLTLHNSEESDSEGDRDSWIVFEGEVAGESGTGHQLAYIKVTHDSGDSDKDGGMYFNTNDGSDTDDALTERLFFDHAGNAQFSTDIGIEATSKLYLDGKGCSGDTFLYEKAADEVVLSCGGEEIRMADATGTGKNTIYGVDAGLSLDSSSDENVFIGAYCADGSLSGADKNVGVGYLSLSALTNGRKNTAVGWSSLLKNTTGQYNTGLGDETLYENLTGTCNTACGFSSLYNTTGSQNSAVGYRAMYTNAGGAYAVAMGYDALHGNTSGNNNTAVGAIALKENEGGSDNVAVGYSAGEHDDGGNDVVTATQCVIIGSEADFETTTPTNEIVIGYGADGNGDNKIALGNTSITAVQGQVDFTAYSDARIKRAIKPTDIGLAFINKLNPIQYKRVNPFDYPSALKERRFKKTSITNEDGTKRFREPDKKPPADNSICHGLIAQEVKAVLDELSVESNIWNETGRGKQGLQYATLVVPLVKAIQELSAKVEALEKQ